MLSAVMARLLVNGGGGLSGIVRGSGRLQLRPFSEDREEARHIGSYLAGVIIGKNVPDARFPHRASPVDLIVIRSMCCFHRRLHVRLFTVPCS